tara:strand:+ start:341 stop:805 length:465 start_codon:yes stop_codon:yes gene_type:complete
MEKIIICPICDDKDRCFEDVQETFSSFMCFNCGFMSNSNYTDENVDKIKHTSRLISELSRFDDEREIHWYPSVVNMGKLGIIFPDGSPSNWVWKMARVVKIDDSEKESYPILGKEDEYYTERLDIDNAMSFGQFEFLSACKAMGIVNDSLKPQK